MKVDAAQTGLLREMLPAVYKPPGDVEEPRGREDAG